MKNILLIVVLSCSLSTWAIDEKPTEQNPDHPTGAIVPPTQKQLKSVKKPVKSKSQPEATTTPTTTPPSAPSH